MVESARLTSSLVDLCGDLKARLTQVSYLLREIAALLNDRLVTIPPFANGNGRPSATFADPFLVGQVATRFTSAKAITQCGIQR